MNHPISLSLTLVGQSHALLKFQLGVVNRAAFPLLLPTPKITGIQFESIFDKRRAEWLTSLLVSTAEICDIVLQPAQTRHFEFRVRPDQIEPSRTDALDDYYRYCIDIRPGEYLAHYQLEIGTNYFDPDSHVELPDLERMAKEKNSIVWLGRAESNRIRVMYTDG
ncbi:MAG: hypothetical protein U1F83_09825 [Verrucomicrobiota bacterium]